MFSTKLTRAANRASSAVIVANPTSTTAAAHRSPPCTAGRRPHQRRHSSSKASCPPDSNASGAKPAPATKALDAAGVAENVVQPRAKRVSKAKKPRAASVSKVEDQFVGLPSVESTQSWRYNDFSMSSFFSLYRPLSLGSTVPRPTTAEEFANIFESRSSREAWQDGNSAERRPEDVIYALHPLVVQELSNSQQNGQDGNVMESGQDQMGSFDGIKHLDGPPAAKNFDSIIAQFQQIPFRAPPPPEPFPSAPSRGRKEKRAKMQDMMDQIFQRQNPTSTRTRSFQTVITMTESTSEDGQSYLIAERGPFVQVPSPQEHVDFEKSQGSTGRSTRMRFVRRASPRVLLPSGPRRNQAQGVRVCVQSEVQRAIRRAPTRRVDMVLISVKRQRKLKMKKHKYKKLMKKTRTLRRRQGHA